MSVPLTISDGSDAASGVDAASGIVERETGTLSNGTCVGWTGTWSPVTLTGGADTTFSPTAATATATSRRQGRQPVRPVRDEPDRQGRRHYPGYERRRACRLGNSAVTVNLTVTETGSGLASTQYRVDGSAFQSGASVSIPAPADHSNDGVHTVEYRSTDNAGNVEALRSATVRIDTTLPLTTDDAPAGWRTRP